MEKPKEIFELEKELNCTFKLVNLEKFNGNKSEKTSEYFTDENGIITGIAICSFGLKEIPKTLTKCKTLSRLNLQSNQINDLKMLSGFQTLAVLCLSENRINDIYPLKELTNIQTLYLNSNQISDISPLETLINLDCLNLSVNKVYNVSPIQNLKKLTNLNLSYNEIQDISCLRDITSLKFLDISHNRINDLIGFSHLKSNFQRVSRWLGNPIDVSELFNQDDNTINIIFSDVNELNFKLSHISILHGIQYNAFKYKVNFFLASTGYEISFVFKKISPIHILFRRRYGRYLGYIDDIVKINPIQIVLLFNENDLDGEREYGCIEGLILPIDGLIQVINNSCELADIIIKFAREKGYNFYEIYNKTPKEIIYQGISATKA